MTYYGCADGHIDRMVARISSTLKCAIAVSSQLPVYGAIFEIISERMYRGAVAHAQIKRWYTITKNA